MMCTRWLGRVGLLVALGTLSMPSLLTAQTALSTTTLASAITDASGRIVNLTSVTNLAARDTIFVDQELMLVQSIASGTTLATVARGQQGTLPGPHNNAALVYLLAGSSASGVSRYYHNRPTYVGCTRTSELYLPHIVVHSGEVWDCPVGSNSMWTILNPYAQSTTRSLDFTISNGSGTTIDAVLIRPARAIRVTACRILYETATTGSAVSAGTAQVGTTVGGAEIVAATSYENLKAVGTSTAMTIVDGTVAANTPVLVRHTGVAAGAGGAVVECDWHTL